MRLAVVGSRDYDTYWVVRHEVQQVAARVGWHDLTLVSGGARGVDTLAERAAHDFGVPIEVYRPDWKRYGSGAGFRRNATIVERADEMLAFYGPTRTAGTTDSVNRALAKGIPVRVFDDGIPAHPYPDGLVR
jgi:hypothetical protein